MKQKFKYRILINLILSVIGSLLITITAFTALSYFKVFLMLDTIYLVILFSFVYIIFMVLVFLKLSDMSFSYLRLIIDSISKIGKGNYSIAIPIEQNDELGEIANSINAMALELKNNEALKAKQLEKERLDNQVQRKVEEEKQQLIMNVAHDVRTPLTSMIGYLQLLDENDDILDAKTRQEYTKIVLDKSLRLSRLINDLFDYTTMSNAKISLKLAKINIAGLIMQIVDEYEPVFEEQDVKVDLEISHPNIFIMGDGEKLVRVFENLISNALKYGKDKKHLEISVKDDLNSVTIIVCNEGKEIAKDDLEHIFDRFYRTDASRQSSTGGVGLGLSIAKSIVEMHEGEIFATSRNGKTSFITVLKKCE